MNIKKEVVDRVKKKLEVQQRQLRMQCETNKYNMKKLVSEQEIMKREIATIGQMIKDLT